MSKLFNVLLIFSIVFTYGECFIQRNPLDRLDARLRFCNIRCLTARIPIRIRNEPEKCLVLLNHNNITVPQCVAQCLDIKGELPANAVECDCRHNRCIPEPSSTTSATTTAPTSSATSTQSTLPSNQPSTQVTTQATGATTQATGATTQATGATTQPTGATSQPTQASTP